MPSGYLSIYKQWMEHFPNTKQCMEDNTNPVYKTKETVSEDYMLSGSE